MVYQILPLQLLLLLDKDPMEPIREDFHEAELFYELSEAAGGSDSESAEDACLSLADEGKERQGTLFS